MPNLRQQLREYFDAQTLSSDKVDEILRAGRAAAAGEPAEGNKIVAFPRWPKLLAMAACLALFAGLGFWMLAPQDKPVSFAMLAPSVIKFFGGAPEMPLVSQDKKALMAWHLAHGAPSDFAIPPKLMALESFACHIVDVKGKPGYLTCFWRTKKPDGTGGELIHLIAARRSDFDRDMPGDKMMMREMGGWSFASWNQGDLIYTIAAAAPMDKVRPFVQTQSSGSHGPQLATVTF
jgi:hypothetical protein